MYRQSELLTSEQMKTLNLDKELGQGEQRVNQDITSALKVVMQQNKVCAPDKLTNGGKAGFIKMMF